MKAIIYILIMLSVIFFNSCAVTKNNKISNETVKQNDSIVKYCNLKSFTARSIEGKTYLNWVVSSNIQNYYFVLIKHTTDNNCVLDVKKGYPSPTDDGLLFCYTDKDSINLSISYSLHAVSPIQIGKQQILYTNDRDLLKNSKSNYISVVNTYFNVVNTYFNNLLSERE